MGFLAGIVILCVASTAFGARGAYGDGDSVFNVLDHGAKGDGNSDDSQAFLKTWEAACTGDQAGQTPTVVVPAGKSFLVHPLHFQGPCKSADINFKILGNVTAPAKIEEWKNCESQSWILFSKINGLTVTGEGTGYLNGRGQIWWNKAKSDILPHDDSNSDCERPKGVTFHQIENLELSGLTHLDSPRVHIRLENCTGAKLTSLLILAPEDSPNTDGIAIGSSSHIQIHDSTIRTGDDCIAIKGGTSFLDVNRVKCGPGHGISVGSLGYEGEYETVEEVNVRNCEFKSSDNGARIKTWQGGSGYVRGIHFENIVISDARNPIIIDQNYCDDQKAKCKMSSSSVVEVSNVTFRNVRGTSGNQPSIKLQCAGGVGCTNIVLDHVKLNPQEPGERSYADCENVVDGNFDDVDPQVSCQTSEG